MAFLPGSHAEFERWTKPVTDFHRLPLAEQTQAKFRNLVSSRANHSGDIAQHSNMASGSGTTTSSAMADGFIAQMNDPNSPVSSADKVIFDADWELYKPASTSVNDRADTVFNLITNLPQRFYFGSLGLNAALARNSASTSIPQ